MTDEQAYQLVEDFANDHTLAQDIEIKHTTHHTSYTSLYNSSRYEDVCLLKSLVDGADAFMFYLRRNGYKIIKTKEKK